MDKKLLFVVPVMALALVGCADPGGTPQEDGGAKDVTVSCVGPDKVFVYSSVKKGGIAVIANHKDCVK